MLAKNIIRHLKIFVAWTSDVEAERNQVETVIKNLQQALQARGCLLEMLDWNSVPPGAGNPEKNILATIDPSNCDIFIGILWKRFGSPPGLSDHRTGQPYASGFQVEYERAYELWKRNGRPRLMLYRSTQPIPTDADVEQLRLVQQFFQGIERRYDLLYKRFSSLENFATQLTSDLAAVIEELLDAGPKDSQHALMHSHTLEEDAERMEFANRQDELNRIQHLLASDSEASIIIYAPTGMGKSRLMEKLHEVLSTVRPPEPLPSYHCLRLDCRIDEGIITSPDLLKAAILQHVRGAELKAGDSDDLPQQLMILMGQSKRLVVLLDHIELMSEKCRIFLRHELLREWREVVKNPLYYPAVIAFGRLRPKEWRGEHNHKVRFDAFLLSHFGEAGIKELLLRKSQELHISLPDDTYTTWAANIFSISHGYPRCIVRLIAWLHKKKYSVRKDFDFTALFDSMVVPVIEREILSDDNLAPHEPVNARSEVAEKLRRVLPYVCVFRFYSVAHLQLLADRRFIEESAIEAMEKQLRQTFFIDPPSEQPWFTPHRTIRRLIADMLHHQQRKAFAMINQAACDSYRDWIAGGVLQGSDQVFYMIEGLYHHCLASRRHLNPEKLQEFIAQYLHSLHGNYPGRDLRSMLAHHMREDAELTQIVQQRGKSEDYHALIAKVENWSA